MKEPKISKFNKEYKIVAYSRINFEEEYKYYKTTIDEILENSKFYTPEFGVYYEDVYLELCDFIDRWASTFVSPAYPNKIFLFSKFLKGTYIAEEIL